ncbi:MAG: glutamine-hydrolyzing GMP synthase [Chloroflexi bacterium]|jgi:GMP synthase (glutamine-hydrolysing)|nr:glutamine-hydrolyzing GMP synthase [Chloroflexota bacterium]
MSDRIVIIDFGSQYTQLIGRRIRDMHVYCELLPWTASHAEAITPETRGIILSGGPQSIYAENAPFIQEYILKSDLPILGICYGMQALSHQSGGKVDRSNDHEYGLAILEAPGENPLLHPGKQKVWMSHGDHVSQLPDGYIGIAHTSSTPYAAMANYDQLRFGLQFHPETHHTQYGQEILENFVLKICRCKPAWTSKNIIDESIQQIRQQVGNGRVLSALSGGVDSAITTALVQRAIGDRVTAVFIDTGLMRQGEAEQIEATFRPILGDRLVMVDASARYFARLKGITDPEEKRKFIGEMFVREFERAVQTAGEFEFLAQGTIYPDVIESKGIGISEAHRIKTHHNVAGLPEDMRFKLVEPLRLLFKDEVRAVGLELDLPPELVWRQPFPGPGLAVRCLGEVTPERVATVRHADAIFMEELKNADLLHIREDENGHLQGSSQAFAALIPVKSVGVMGDQRTYAETIVLRAVTSVDFMTADWARLPQDLLASVSNRIVNEVAGVNRVVYDISSKPPATIEWE